MASNNRSEAKDQKPYIADSDPRDQVDGFLKQLRGTHLEKDSRVPFEADRRHLIEMVENMRLMQSEVGDHRQLKILRHCRRMVTLALQYPGQLSAGMEAEPLENVSIVIMGQVPDTDGLARRLATEAMPPDVVANRLRALDPGEWLVRLPPEFHAETPDPICVESLPLPPGDPDGEEPLDRIEQTLFDAKRNRLEYRTLETCSIPVPGSRFDTPMTAALVAADAPADSAEAATASADSPTISQSHTHQSQSDGEALSPGLADCEDGSTATDEPLEQAPATRTREGVATETTGPRETERTGERPEAVQSTFDFTHPPGCVTYLDSGALECNDCGDRYSLDGPGLENAIECCNSLDIVEWDGIPPVAIDLKLSPAEIAASPYSRGQLAFLQLVHDAQHEHGVATAHRPLRSAPRLEVRSVDPRSLPVPEE